MTAHLSPPDPNRPAKYPWDQWLDGQEWTILRGRDYWGDTEAMVARVRRAASRRRLRVRIQRWPGWLVLQSVPRTGPGV